jgi:homoserine O-acetyltransferase
MQKRAANKSIVAALALAMLAAPLLAAEYAAPRAGTVVRCNFEFASGDSLPEVRMHYLTLGQFCHGWLDVFASAHC